MYPPASVFRAWYNGAEEESNDFSEMDMKIRDAVDFMRRRDPGMGLDAPGRDWKLEIPQANKPPAMSLQ